MTTPFLSRRWLLSAMAALTVAPGFARAQTPAGLLRVDTISGAYELVHWASAGLVFVATTRSFEQETGGAIHVLDASDLHELRKIDLPRRPFALALDRSTGRLYAGNTLDGSLTVIDARDGKVLDTIQLGQPNDKGVEHVRMIVLDEKKGLAFVTSPGRKGVVWVVDIRANTLLHRIEGGVWPAGAAYDAASGRLYASGGGRDEILVIDPVQGKIIGTIATGDTSSDDPKQSRHFFVNLALDPQGQRLFAADANSGTVHVFDIASGKVIATPPVGPGTLDVAYNPMRAEIYATWRGVTEDDPSGTGGLVVIDAGDFTLRKTIPLPVHPNSLDIAEDGQTLYLTVKAPHDPKHPAYHKDAADSVLRLDLTRMGEWR